MVKSKKTITRRKGQSRSKDMLVAGDPNMYTEGKKPVHARACHPICEMCCKCWCHFESI